MLPRDWNWLVGWYKEGDGRSVHYIIQKADLGLKIIETVNLLVLGKIVYIPRWRTKMPNDYYGEWDPRELRPELKETIDKILYSIATQSNTHALQAIQDVMDPVKESNLICIDSGIKKVEKKVKGSFGIVDSFIMGMALGSGGKYICR